MDPVSLIVAALVAGVAAGTKDVAGAAVKDAYRALKGLVRRRLEAAEDPTATTVAPEALLAAHEQRPETWRVPMEEALRAAGVAADADLVASAQRLLELVDPEGAQRGKYTVDLRGAQGVQVGDGGTMTVNINAPGPSGRTSD